MTENIPPLEPSTAYWSGIATAIGLDFAIPTVISVFTSVFALALGMAGVRNTFFYLVNGTSGLLFFGIGLAQWFWLVPAARHMRAKGRGEFAKGLISGGWMVFILNASCWGLLGGMLFLNR